MLSAPGGVPTARAASAAIAEFASIPVSSVNRWSIFRKCYRKRIAALLMRVKVEALHAVKVMKV